ncbi:MAG TPA: hypothetical protein VLA91_00695 [Acidimicrobiia bacterium]|nr:hypothetical protein [Acidimicrobiia bacterium]
MSSSLTHSGAGMGVPSWNFGLAAAGLAVVIAIGVGFAASQDDAVTVTDTRSAQPMVSDAHRAKAELLAERQVEPTWSYQYQDYYQFLMERAQEAGN